MGMNTILILIAGIVMSAMVCFYKLLPKYSRRCKSKKKQNPNN